MKYKTTQKEIKANYNKIIKVGYCKLQHLLNYCEAKSYTSNAYGWASDIYTFNNVAISTGYAPFGNITPDYKTLRKYDYEAQKICYGNFDYEEKRDKLNILIKKFIAEVTEEAK